MDLVAPLALYIAEIQYICSIIRGVRSFHNCLNYRQGVFLEEEKQHNIIPVLCKTDLVYQDNVCDFTFTMLERMCQVT